MTELLDLPIDVLKVIINENSLMGILINICRTCKTLQQIVCNLKYYDRLPIVFRDILYYNPGNSYAQYLTKKEFLVKYDFEMKATIVYNFILNCNINLEEYAKNVPLSSDHIMGVQYRNLTNTETNRYYSGTNTFAGVKRGQLKLLVKENASSAAIVLLHADGSGAIFDLHQSGNINYILKKVVDTLRVDVPCLRVQNVTINFFEVNIQILNKKRQVLSLPYILAKTLTKTLEHQNRTDINVGKNGSNRSIRLFVDARWHIYYSFTRLRHMDDLITAFQCDENTTLNHSQRIVHPDQF